ncbi:hypothetical protein GCM10017688_55430 [Streptomyces ramulosus]
MAGVSSDTDQMRTVGYGGRTQTGGTGPQMPAGEGLVGIKRAICTLPRGRRVAARASVPASGSRDPNARNVRPKEVGVSRFTFPYGVPVTARRQGRNMAENSPQNPLGVHELTSNAEESQVTGVRRRSQTGA